MICVTYARTCITYIVEEGAGSMGLMWSGFAMIMGGSMGAIAVFLMTTVFKLFVSELPCPGM